MVLGKGFTFQIIEEALSTAIDSMTWMVNAGAGRPTIRKETMFLHSLIESIYLLSDTASRKVRNLLTNKTCFINWVELRAYRQWTGLMCQIICTFECHHNSIKRIIKFISNTRQKKKNNTDLLLRLPDVSALSGCTRRIPLSKNESNTTGNTSAWRFHAGLQSPLFWPFAQNLYLLCYNVAGKTVLEGESRHQSSAKQQ